MKGQIISLILFDVILIIAITCAHGSPAQSEKQTSLRSQFKLPKLFDFDRFKQIFNKSYTSLVESLARRKLYLARAFNVFLSAISYRHRHSSSYLAVNQMSDWTADEIRRTHIDEESLKIMTESLDLDKVILGRSESNHHRPKDVDSKVKQTPKQANQNRILSLDKLVRGPESGEETGGKSALSDVQAADLLVRSPRLSELRKMLGSAASKLSTSEVETSPLDTLPKDTKYIDLTKTNCFLQPRDQGKCGSCYAFSAVSLYEWHYCIATGNRVAFSEQYVIDCGHRYNNSTLNGCESGMAPHVGYFFNEYGVELLSYYPYRAYTGLCPYDSKARPKSMGHLRIKDRGFDLIFYPSFDLQLEHGPILVNMYVNRVFSFYGGGVDTPLDCNQALGAHAMVVVGSGHQDGQDYWLLRNSFGVEYGEAGYYKLSKEASKCIHFGAGFHLHRFEVPKKQKNKVSNEVRKNYLSFLALDGDEK